MHASLIDEISAKENKNTVIECQDRQKEQEQKGNDLEGPHSR